MSDAVRKRIEDVSHFAQTAFTQHVTTCRLAQGLYRNWRCQRPGSWCYGFDVTTEPGRLYLTGDLGLLVLEREADMVAWACLAIDDIDYFAGKVVQEIPVREWDAEVAREWVAEMQAEMGMTEGLASDLLAVLDDGQGFFDMCLYESGFVDGCDWPCFENYKPGFLWCREALKWFLAHWPPSIPIAHGTSVRAAG